MLDTLSTQLQQIYGELADIQMSRYQAAARAFEDRYGPGEIYAFRAPGRVNLIGEHTDYNHGYVLPVALDKDILLLARPRHDSRICLANLEDEFGGHSFTISTTIPTAPNGDWSNYGRGAAQELARRQRNHNFGIDGLVSSIPPLGVPRAAGLSSSSALTVALAVALAHFADWTPDPATMAQYCSDAEWYVGTRGGIMDQFIALSGQRHHALFLDCRPLDHSFRTESIPMPPAYRLLVVNSGVRHTNVHNEFNARVAACRAGVALLRQTMPSITHLRDVETVDWATLEPLLPVETTVAELQNDGHDLGDLPRVPADMVLRVRACCRHVWSENRRVLAAVTAMRDGQIHDLGALLNAAHASARDDYAISIRELEVLVEAALTVDGCIGARLTGAGWGGCIVALVHDDAVDEFQRRIPRIYREKTGSEAEIFPCQSAPGAGLVGQLCR